MKVKNQQQLIWIKFLHILILYAIRIQFSLGQSEQYVQLCFTTGLGCAENVTLIFFLSSEIQVRSLSKQAETVRGLGYSS